MHLATPREVGPDQEAAAVRRFDCRAYQTCLDFAARSRWASWSCDSCSAFSATPRDEPSLRRGCPLSFEG
jgi:hypothetical protein